jgi:hypothetical protein
MSGFGRGMGDDETTREPTPSVCMCACVCVACGYTHTCTYVKPMYAFSCSLTSVARRTRDQNASVGPCWRAGAHKSFFQREPTPKLQQIKDLPGQK